MDVVQNLRFISSYYVYSKLLMTLIFKVMMLTESGTLLKNHVICKMLKYYITALFRQFSKTLYHFFYLSSANKYLETCMPV